jgi:1-acyl-sn-glycerol-3-phosphate acyltransferase
MSRAHRPKAGSWIRLCVVIIFPLTNLFFKLRWHHLDRIPARGGVLIAVNHISQADTLAMARMVWESGRIPRFLIKSSVFGWPILGPIMTGAGQLPVYRASSQAADSLRDAERALNRGECVIIYPEGTITSDPDYWPMQAKTGVARLALACPEVPVLPVGQWGAHRTLGRRGRFRPVPRHWHQASVGEPLDLDKYRDTEPTGEVLREATDEIMAAITDQVERLRSEKRSGRT